MKKTTFLLCSALICCAPLFTSCEEDKSVVPPTEEGENGDGNETEDPTAPKTDYTLKAIIDSKGQTGYEWKAEDKFTLWDVKGKKGYEFLIDNASINETKNEANFAGKANLDEADNLFGIYPTKEGATFEEIATFTIEESQTGTTDAASLQKPMAGSAVIDNGEVSSMTFAPIMATINFKLTNKKTLAVKIKNISIASTGSEVFPGKMTLLNDGTTGETSDERKSITINTNDAEVASNGNIESSINVLPTTKLTASTTVDLKVTFTTNGASSKTLNDDASEETKTIRSSADIQDLLGITDGEQIIAGSTYTIDAVLDDKESAIPECGYALVNGTYELYNAKGIIAWFNTVNDFDNDVVIKFIDEEGNDIESPNKEINFGGETLNPVASFSKTFDANGAIFTNVNIGDINVYGKGNWACLFKVLETAGAVKNLTLKDLTVSADGIAPFVYQNSGTIEDCTIDGGEFKASSKGGGLIASVTNSGIIKDCKVTGEVLFESTEGNTGGIIAECSNIAKLENVVVDENVTIKLNGKGYLGGLIAALTGGELKGSYFLGTITNIGSTNNCGALIGSSWPSANSSVTACYSWGTIDSNSSYTSALVGNAGGGAELTKTITGCYAGSKFINKDLGYGINANSNSGTWKFDYVFNITSKKSTSYGTGSSNGDLQGVGSCTAETLKTDKLTNLNDAISSSGYQFEVNTDQNKQPLVLIKKTN